MPNRSLDPFSRWCRSAGAFRMRVMLEVRLRSRRYFEYIYWRTGFVSFLAGVLVLALSPVLLAQTPAGQAKAGAVSRTADGKPDLSGVWSANNVTGFSPDAGAEAAARDFAAGRIPWFGFAVEELPMQPWAAERYKTNREGMGPAEKAKDGGDPIMYPYCLPEGFPRAYTISAFELVQTPERIYMLFDRNHQVRRIYLDGQKHLEGYGPSFLGTAHGQWDGDTLVVETSDLLSLDGYAWLDTFGHVFSDALRVTERIRRTAHDTLQSEMTFDDPKTYTRPWSSRKIFRLIPGADIAENITCYDHLREDFLRDMKSGKAQGRP